MEVTEALCTLHTALHTAVDLVLLELKPVGPECVADYGHAGQ